MTDKTFTVVGKSNLFGKVKWRFANDLTHRFKVLERNGHTDIQLIELPEAMTKEAAIAYALAYTGEWVTSVAKRVKKEDTAPAAAAAPVVSEAAIDAFVAEMTANGRPRNEKGHFIKMEELRARAIAALSAA